MTPHTPNTAPPPDLEPNQQAEIPPPATEPPAFGPLTYIGVALGLLALVALFLWARSRAHDDLKSVQAIARALAPEEKHAVSPAMAAASRDMVGQTLGDFAMKAHDGKTYRLAELLQHGPVVLTFIKDGCPCSEEAQPFFNLIHDAYAGHATVLGVINVAETPARAWAEKFHCDYPILIDPPHRLMRETGAANSAYVVVIDAGQRIVAHWPGYSGPMIRDLGATLAQLAQTREIPLKIPPAPPELYSGCPFDFPDDSPNPAR
jgi:peroxiredoxin